MSEQVLICVDPETRRLYRYGVISNSIKIESNLSAQVLDKIATEHAELEELKGFELSFWKFRSTECWHYRRRVLHKYLVQKEALEFPSFVVKNEIAFASRVELQVRVDLSSYLHEDDLSDSEENIYVRNREINLVTNLTIPGGELVKQVYRKMRSIYSIELKPKIATNKFCVKVKGKNDYFITKDPLMNYIEVRNSLRDNLPVNLTLTEIPKLHEGTRNIDWESPIDLETESVLFWYPPVRLPFDIDAFVAEPSFLKEPRAVLKPTKPSRILSQLLKGKFVEPDLYTNECEWPFRVKLCGIENLFSLYDNGILGNATKNGITELSYVFRSNSKEKFVTGRNSSGSFSSNRRCSVPKIRNKIPSSASKSHRQAPGSLAASAHMNHSNSCKSMSEFQSIFSLNQPPYVFVIEIMLLYGDKIIKNCFKQVKYFPFSLFSRFYEWVSFPIRVSELPKETRLGLNVYTITQRGQTVLIGCSCKPVYDELGCIRTGLVSMNLWPFYKIEERLSSMEEFWGEASGHGSPSRRQTKSLFATNVNTQDFSTVYVQFDSFISNPVRFNLKDPTFSVSRLRDNSSPWQTNRKSTLNEESQSPDVALLKETPEITDLINLQQVLQKDTLTKLSKEEKHLLFICRDHYKSLPQMLQLFLKSVNWSKPLQVKEAHRMLNNWEPLSPEDALAMLNADFPDEKVRLYATKRVALFSDNDLASYMNQFVQALIFEPQHFTSLGELLISRSLKNPYVVGHELFWNLRSQLHLKASCERLGLILEQFLMLCGKYRKVLLKELEVIKLAESVGGFLENKDKSLHSSILKDAINNNRHRIPKYFTVPVGSSIEAIGLDTENCKVYDSKQLPFRLMLKTSELGSRSIPVMYKKGDDLQQDILCLQIIKVMDKIWLENGLDLKIKTYKVMSTGDRAGMIELVMDSETIDKIQVAYGGALGPLKKEPLLNYIKENNLGDLDTALDNFTRSCAGWCVATFVLGIGDRHSDNLMICKSGHLFHIDYGHFLGTKKKKLGLNRERSNFVLTREMVFVMGGRNDDNFLLFKDYCCKAYNLLRKEGNLILNLLKMMLSAGIKELVSEKNLHVPRDRLALHLTEMEAKDYFLSEIDQSLNDLYRNLDNFIHSRKRN